MKLVVRPVTLLFRPRLVYVNSIIFLIYYVSWNWILEEIFMNGIYNVIF